MYIGSDCEEIESPGFLDFYSNQPLDTCVPSSFTPEQSEFYHLVNDTTLSIDTFTTTDCTGEPTSMIFEKGECTMIPFGFAFKLIKLPGEE